MQKNRIISFTPKKDINKEDLPYIIKLKGGKLEEQEEIKKLAETLRSSGIAASDYDAANKARAILGYANRDFNPKISEPKKEHKEKIDEIIKEVDQEIQEKKEIKETTLGNNVSDNGWPVQNSAEEQNTIESANQDIQENSDSPNISESSDIVEDQPAQEQNNSNFDEHSFKIAESNLSLSEATSGEIMTNDKSTLEKEKEAENLEQMPSQENSFESGKDPLKNKPNHSMIMTNDELNEENESRNSEEEEEGIVKEKQELTSEEKKMTDLSKLFDVNN